MEVSKIGLSKQLVCIEYPGLVQNVDKMLETLGGIQEVSRVNIQKNRRLELRFRPNDTYCKPACGDRGKTNAVLLKIKVRVKKNKPDNEEESEQKVVGCEIVGRIQTAFRFKSICDFQFLPMFQDEDGRMRDISSTLIPDRLDGDSLQKWVDGPANYFLPPAAFSRIDSQSLNTYMYRKDAKDSVGSNEGPLIGRTRKRRSGHAIFVSFDIGHIPVKPREKALKFLEVKFLSGIQYEKIKKCFEERPVWSKLALMCVTGYHHDQLKYLLPSVAYYFVTGPFRVMWVRFGYDPRREPASRIYQTLDYRIRAPAGLLSKVKAKRSYANYLLPTKSTHPGAKSVVISKDTLSTDNVEAEEDQIHKTSFQFVPDTLPPARQLFYQYCDVKVPEIEAMLSRLPKVSPSMTCDPKHGWLPPGFDNQCRTIINKYVLVLLKATISEDSFKDEEYADDSSDGEQIPWEEEFEDEDIDDDAK
ncbi:hypothetical protein GE061_014294 [Apolygus lucorum]|uniref:Uncharacterized protein n=1 Tax=Apolygus lucorum TaxID=248454 RepID=A0A6A4K4Z8_APOLU|nr:hypothetical protein GE061_014294 [Apolygus lucorum]